MECDMHRKIYQKTSQSVPPPYNGNCLYMMIHLSRVTKLKSLVQNLKKNQVGE